TARHEIVLADDLEPVDRVALDQQSLVMDGPKPQAESLQFHDIQGPDAYPSPAGTQPALDSSTNRDISAARFHLRLGGIAIGLGGHVLEPLAFAAVLPFTAVLRGL